MKRALALLVLLAATPVTAPLAQEAQKQEMAKMTLKVGDSAPDFTLLSDEWETVKLATFAARRMCFSPCTFSLLPVVERNNFRRSRLESPRVRSTLQIQQFSALAWIVLLPMPPSRSKSMSIFRCSAT